MDLNRDLPPRGRAGRPLPPSAGRQKDMQLRDVERIAGIGSWRYDVDTETFWWSSGMYHLFGLSPSREPQSLEDVLELIHPDDRRRLTEEIRAARPFRSDYRVLLAGGKERWIHEKIEIERGPGRRPRAYHGTSQDVTASRQAQRQLREREEQCRDLVRTLPSAVVVYAPDGAIIMSNASAQQLLGLSERQLLQRTADDPAWTLLSEDGSHMKREEWPVNRVLNEKRAVREVVAGIVRPGGGDPVWVLMSAEPVFSKEEIERVVLSFMDMTARTGDLPRAGRHLGEGDDLKAMLIAGMGRELRMPLHTIIGFSGLLLRGVAGELNEEQQHRLSMIKSGGDHLLELAEDVIEAGRIESGEAVISRREFDLADVADRVLAAFDPEAARKKIARTCTRSGNTLVWSDRSMVRRVLMNLVGNALKFTAAGTVTVEISGTGKKVEAAVKDTGIGLAPADVARLFRPFPRIDRGDAGKGTGLGLYLSRRIALFLGGDITVTSSPGKGSTFILSLPGGPPRAE